MFRKALLVVPWLIVLSFGVVRPASAQWAVIDVGAIAQLIEQYETLQEQLTTARDHLEQARQEYESLTGDRGMQHLLEGQWRNYLPGHWLALTDALYGLSPDFPAFQRISHGYLDTNAILTDAQMGTFSEADQKHLEDMRHATAAMQALTQQALGETSERFNGLQTLIDAIGSAEDPKAVLDLQARIQAEQVMLENDSNKIHTIFTAVQAEEEAQRLRRREQAIADVGSYRNLPPLELPLPEILP
ncbi:MAG: type IV secretion system protein [Gammaproteobacteria bacterium]